MKRSYSLYEAKAKLSEIVRRVRERGERVTVTYRGEPVAEIRPIEPAAGGGWAARLQELERRGVVQRAEVGGHALRPLARRRGALQRFLADRDG